MEEDMSDAPPEQISGEDEHAEQKLANEEYKIWKKNSVWLYDMIYSRALEWPTLSMQWFPDKRKVPGTSLSEHRALLGTHTSGAAQNYLQVASVEVPDQAKPNVSNYDEQRGEIGGYGSAKKPFTWNIIQKINHPTEVNKARYQPQNPEIIATMSADSKVYIFDRTKHTMNPKSSEFVCELELQGHEAEGYGLDWSPLIEGQLATGAEDNTVRIWDIVGGFTNGSKVIKPLRTYTHHTSIVNDVQHHPIHKMWIGTVSDDLTVQVIDTRIQKGKGAVFKTEAHKDAVNCLAFHPLWESILATGSADKSVAMWDLRKFDTKLHSLEWHRDAVMKLEWNPMDPAILASGSADKRILFWDMSKLGDEQDPDEAEDGPPELLFMHGGFTNKICDFNWNKSEPWLIAAAAEDNQIQVFRPSRALVQMPKKKKEKVPNDEVQE
ncbi:WD40 repeat-like protein [Patellaria atrata CBS 101060]|uniref:WD40 repeat-like protein n=1 Tax=Patellaria atrata CBS 101060 TaxID=1346257 RepID=A0A9P4SFH3_9PEZI|nr:WD40 repeat-like protein [Patellaria atrata CBS 101060]